VQHAASISRLSELRNRLKIGRPDLNAIDSTPMRYWRKGLKASPVIVGLTLVLVFIRVFVAGVPKEHLSDAALRVAVIAFAEITVLTPVVAAGLWFSERIGTAK
jgi:hypothetical protein